MTISNFPPVLVTSGPLHLLALGPHTLLHVALSQRLFPAVPSSDLLTQGSLLQCLPIYQMHNYVIIVPVFPLEEFDEGRLFILAKTLSIFSIRVLSTNGQRKTFSAAARENPEQFYLPVVSLDFTTITGETEGLFLTRLTSLRPFSFSSLCLWLQLLLLHFWTLC